MKQMSEKYFSSRNSICFTQSHGKLIRKRYIIRKAINECSDSVLLNLQPCNVLFVSYVNQHNGKRRRFMKNEFKKNNFKVYTGWLDSGNSTAHQQMNKHSVAHSSTHIKHKRQLSLCVSRAGSKTKNSTEWYTETRSQQLNLGVYRNTKPTAQPRGL